MFAKKLKLILFGVLVSTLKCLSLQSQDRVNAFVRTLHGGWKTPWIEVPIFHMPRFRTPDVFRFKPTLPMPKDSEEDRFNPNENIKISFSFAENKLIVPWIIVYEAKESKSLERLIVTFDHDEFDILRVETATEYSKEKVDGPAVEAFDIVYRWRGVQEEDLSLGVGVMFTLTLLCLLLVSCFVTSTYDGDGGSQRTRLHSSHQSSPSPSRQREKDRDYD
eukprot:gene2380-4624_t